jgi:hypothetical protein
MLLEYFAEEARVLQRAVFLPLGPAVTDAIDWLVSEGRIDGSRVLSGMPHPSGANAERIHYMTGRKPRAQLSSKTEPDTLDRAREDLRAKIRGLR